jgi:2-(1,2-epoxy-1,2-dihydrophenyl)acetyl-CoA isomerase
MMARREEPRAADAAGKPEDPVVVLRDGAVARIELNRPERLNAMSGQLMEDLLAALEDVAVDDDVRCVVLTGRGRGFCAGGDADRLARRPQTVDEVAEIYDARVRDLRRFQRSPLLLHTMRKPTVAIVNGPAVGGGFALALACDFRVAISTARMGVGYARVGISTDFGASYFLQQMIGDAKARELLLLPGLLSAPEAHALGLLTGVAEPEMVETVAAELITQLAEGPTVALGRTKENLHLATHASLPEVLDREAENARLTGLHADAAEGALALIEKRDPRFSGR